jgi:hypothetical protein
MDVKPTRLPPPFAYATESAAFERRWLEELPKRLYALQIQFIPERNILKYAHGTHWTSHNTDGDEVPGEFKAHGEEFSVSAKERAGGELEKLTTLVDECARKFASAMVSSMHETLTTTTNTTGNVVSWNRKAKNAPAAFLELLRKVEFGVTEDGKPSLPSFLDPDPAFLAEVQEHEAANPSFREEVERIKAEKIADALSREADRKAKFKLPP